MNSSSTMLSRSTTTSIRRYWNRFWMGL